MELTRQVDLRRETHIEDIHEHSNKVIQQIAQLKEESLAKVKTVLKSKDTFEGIKTRLNELNAMFDSLEMDDEKHKEIMWQKKSDEIEKMIEPLLGEFKLELLKKFYKFETNECLLP